MDRSARKARLQEEFVARTSHSRKVADRARRVFPGGETRSITFFAPYPVSLVSASGAVLTDVDGNTYLDVLNNYTSLVHGHAFPPVVEAAREAASQGVVYPAPHEAQLKIAEHLIQRHPVAEQIRFTNSGTEATLLALRTAQAATGRDRFLLFEGAYHGSAPIITGQHPQVTRVPFNDLVAAEATLDDSYAAVLVEPALGVGGVISAQPGFLDGLADLAHRVGALLVIDEVQTLRAAVGGASELYGVDADLAIMAKLIGGGYPVGALVGREKYLRVLNLEKSANPVNHSGTFNGHLVTARAGLVALEHLTVEAIARMNGAAEKLASRIESSGRTTGLPVTVLRFGSMLHVHMQGTAPTHFGEVRQDSDDVLGLHMALLLEGVYAAPRGLLNLSTALTDDQLEDVAAGYERAFSRLVDG